MHTTVTCTVGYKVSCVARTSNSDGVGLFQSQLRTLETHYHLTLDPAVLWTSSNDTSKPICLYNLNLMPPAPLYLWTLWRYTNAVIIIIIIAKHHLSVHLSHS